MFTAVLFTLVYLFGNGPVLQELAEEPDALLSQQEAVKLALERNPDLRISLEELKAVESRIQQAREFPATTFEFDFDQQEKLLRSGETYYGFSQEFEYPTRRGLRIRVAKEEVKASEADYELARWETALVVKSIYQRLSLGQELLVIAKENLAISEKLLLMAREKYNAGSVGKLDVLRASVEAATAENELLVLENEERALRMQLNYLLGRQAEEELTTTPLSRGRDVAESADELVGTALSKRIEFRSLQRQQAAAALRQSLARSALYPDFSIAFSRHRLAGEPDNWDLVLGVSVPIFGRSAIRGQVAEAQAEERALLAAVEAGRARVEMEVRSAYKDTSKLAERVTRFQEVILTQAKEAFEIAEASYREGEIENLELLESQRTLQDVKQGYAETVFQYNLALVELERAVGTALNWEPPEGETLHKSSGEKR